MTKTALLQVLLVTLLCYDVLADVVDGGDNTHFKKTRRQIRPVVNDGSFRSSSGETLLNLDPNISEANPTRKTSLCRQNYADDSEDAVNDQINLELYASQVYMSMSYHFDRDDVALPGFAKFFKKSSDEEREHAEKLLRFQNQRGGRIKMREIRPPEHDDWGTGRDAMWHALTLEKEVNERLLLIERLANQHGDPQMADFITENFLVEQVESIEELARHVTNLDRVGSGLGEYMYDRETLGED